MMTNIHHGYEMRRRAMATLASVDLNLLVPLRALLKHRSVTRAAEEAGVSQPAMSNTLRRLRRLLNDELLIRVGKNYELTARATALLAPLEIALRAIDNEVVNPPVFSPADSHRTFTVAASNAATVTVLAGLAQKLSTDAPHTSLHVVPLTPKSDQLLGDSGVDLVLLPDPMPTVLPRERLFDDDWVCVVDIDNTEVGDTLKTSDLSRLPHVVFDMSGIPLSAEQTLQALVPTRRIQAVVSDFLTVAFLLRGTTMISVLQGRLARLLAAHGLVRVLKSPLHLPPIGIDMVWNPRGGNDPAYAWLRQQLLDLMGRQD
ncbi:LysR family transcriptional regulator [Rhodococcus koreensis]|uniref:LysR family transcriptional regulator n=1 Tax=Rhodococcus koreensis TaxID=99653 RepID=UPI00366CA66F